MTRPILISLAVLIGIAPLAQAQALTCRDRLDELSKRMEAVIDAKTKQDASVERTRAQQAMAKNDESGCMSHAESGLNMMHGD